MFVARVLRGDARDRRFARGHYLDARGAELHVRVAVEDATPRAVQKPALRPRQHGAVVPVLAEHDETELAAQRRQDHVRDIFGVSHGAAPKSAHVMNVMLRANFADSRAGYRENA